MIDARELRIGNWVNYIGDALGIRGYNQIISIDGRIGLKGYEKSIFKTLPLCSFDPIALTPEILEKINAEIYNQSLWDKLQFGKERYYDVGELRLIYKNNKFYHALLGVDKEINFVHQLQNLYFALTQQELTITI